MTEALSQAPAGCGLTAAASLDSSARYLPALTGIRAVAALLVLLLHTDQNVPANIPSVFPLLLRGYLGVDFFFLLSGFIITHVYLQSLAGGGRAAIGIYLWHRFIRLYPVHVTVLLGLVVIVGAATAVGFHFNSDASWRTTDIVWNLVLVHAWGFADIGSWNAPSWSISAEWFAYLLFPFAVPLLVRLRAPAIALVLAAGILVATAAVFAIAGWSLNSWIGAPALTRVTGEFFCGAMLCRAVGAGSSAGSGRAVALPSRLGDLVGAAAFAAFLVGASTGADDFSLTGMLALTILGAALSRGFLAQFLGCRPMLWLGEISYSVYMVHFPVLIILRRPLEWLGFAQWGGREKILTFAGVILLVIAIAAAMYSVVEKPARQKLRNRLGVLAPA
jgi:peptidoglycan/LPS O-acetylase OafA/YrhL